MLFTTSKENLNTAVNAVQKAINPKSIISAYSCIKIDVRDNLAVFTGAGLDVSIECSIPVQMEKEGLLLVNARYFGDIVRRLPDIPITIEHTETMEMTIRYEKSVFTLRTTASDDFPLFDKFQGDLNFSVPAETFKKLIRQTSFAASADDLKGIFTGLLWELNDQEISLIGSDTHRLAWAKGKIEIAKQKDDGEINGINEVNKIYEINQINEISEVKKSFIIPAKVSIEIARLIQDSACHIQVGRNMVFFSFDNIKVNCHIMEGSFPNFRQVIPTQFVTEIGLENNLLRDAAERISLFAASSNFSSTIYFEITEGVLSIYSQSDIGFGREEFQVAHEGSDLKIAFNSRYITDGFKVIDGDHIELKLSGEISAGIMKEREDEEFTYLVLPAKVS
jgi:DNA polymerase-3 subunit beta